MEKTNEWSGYKIGSIMYAVHHKYPDENLAGGRVIVCRVKTFENRKGHILPVLTEVGNAKREICPITHLFFTNVTEAINAISTYKQINSWRK